MLSLNKELILLSNSLCKIWYVLGVSDSGETRFFYKGNLEKEDLE